MKLDPIALPIRPQALRRDVPCAAAPVFKVAASADHGTISIFDFIGGDVRSATVAAALREIGRLPVTVQINSLGGDYFEAVGIFNLLRQHGQPITVHVLGVAASAASLIAMAGDRIEIARNGQMMIHRASAGAYGSAEVMDEVARILSALDADMAATYAERSGTPLAKVVAMMAAETFMSADEALELGFADALLPRDADPAPAQADEIQPSSKADLANRLRAIGFARAAAERIAAGGFNALRGGPSDTDLAVLADRFKSHTADLRAALQRGA